MVLGVQNLLIGFSTIVKGNHTPLHVDAVTDSSKLP